MITRSGLPVTIDITSPSSNDKIMVEATLKSFWINEKTNHFIGDKIFNGDKLIKG